MSITKPAAVIGAAMALAVLAPSPALAETPGGTASNDGEVLCVQVEDGAGNPIGPKVCIPWFLPVP